jgi:hypothetical protein
MFQNCTSSWDLDGSLHLTVPSRDRLNQTEPATFSILPCWAFLGILIFSFISPYSIFFQYKIDAFKIAL